jgi:hypothetical protein
MTNIYNWSTIVGDNATSDGNLWPEGQLPSTVNDSSRDNMASVARWRADIGGGLVSGGSANHYTLTLATVGMNALADGMEFSFRANHTNTGLSYLSVNGLTEYPIGKDVNTGVSPGEIVAGRIYTVTYVAATPAFVLHTGASPGDNFAISANVNAAVGFTVTNANGGTEAAAAMLLKNGVNTAYYGLKGTGATSYLGWNAGEAAVYNTGNIVLMADAAGGAFKFISAGAEVMTLSPAGVFTRTGGFDIQGTNSNDAAPAGYIGECIVGERTQGLAIAVPNLTPTTLTSVSLTAGDWDVDAVAHFIGEPAMQLTVIAASISLLNNALDTSPGRLVATNMSAAPHFTAAWGVEVIPIPPYRISLPGPTTVYLVGRTDFTSGSTLGFGRIQARRVR